MMLELAPPLNVQTDCEIGDLALRPSLLRAEGNGKVAHVEPKVMEVLMLLVQADGATVSRDHLIETCWGGRVVSEDAVTRTLSKARKLGQLTSPPAFVIETLPRVGARLVVHPGHRDSTRFVSTAQNETKVSEPLLLVRPFENLSADPDLRFFSDGVTDDILGRLIRGSHVRVMGRASSFQSRTDEDLSKSVGSGITHVVEGSVRRAGNRVRIQAHLTDIRSGAGLWSERFDRQLDDIFALQDEIAEAISLALFQAFTPKPKATVDPATYDLYLRAKSLQSAPIALAENIASLELVTQSAPKFADAWGRLASLRGFQRLGLPYHGRSEITLQLRDDIAQCYALDPQNPQANYADYWMAAPFGDFLEQERVIQKVLGLSYLSADDYGVASFHSYNVGHERKAYSHAHRAFEIDPKDWAASINYGIALWGIGQPQEASVILRYHIDNWPDCQHGSAYAMLVASHRGDWAEIDRLTDPERLKNFPLREHSGILATAATMRYPTPENKQLLFEMMKGRCQKIGAIDVISLAFSSLVGMAEQAYDYIETLPFGPTGGKYDTLGMMGYRTHLLFGPANKSGRADPRFVTLCARLGLVTYWLTTGLWPDCADEVPYDFKAACAAAASIPCDPFPA